VVGAKLSFKTPSACTPHGRRSRVTSNIMAEADVLPLDGGSCAAQKLEVIPHASTCVARDINIFFKYF